MHGHEFGLIADLEQRLRERYNDQKLSGLLPQSVLAKEDRTAAALDTLRSTTLALIYVEHRGVPASRVTTRVRIGEKYLLLYGALQAAYMQQDAISDLWKLLAGGSPKLDGLSAWQDIRVWRDAISHSQGSSPLVAERSISRHGFSAWLHNSPKKPPRLQHVPLRQLLRGYAENAVTLLRRLDLVLSTRKKGQSASS